MYVLCIFHTDTRSLSKATPQDLRAQIGLRCWESMPGSMIMLEAMLRQDGCLFDSKQLYHAMRAINHLLIKSCPSSLMACVSLVSTLLKHTFKCVENLGKPQDRGQAGMHKWYDCGDDSEHGLVNLYNSMCDTLIATFDCKHCSGSFNRADIMRYNTDRRPIFETFHLPAVTCNNGFHVMFECNSQRFTQQYGFSKRREQAICMPPFNFTSSLRHHSQCNDLLLWLKAILALTLTHLGHTPFLNLPTVVEESQPEWFTKLSPRLEKTLVSLINLVTTRPPNILEGEEKARYAQATDACWDAYATGLFSGKLLSGCASLECTNMMGCSEAALPTPLCGHCRMVHYCSVECQKAAWKAGGHKMSCGRVY